MLYNTLYPIAENINVFNLFQYITVRAGGALMTAFILSLLFGPKLITHFRAWQKGGSTVKEILPHQAKKGTPTMGGVLVLFSFILSTILWTDITSPYVWLLLFVAFSFGGLGFLDDVCTLSKRWKNGVPGRIRLLTQTMCSALFVYLAVKLGGPDATSLYMPFFKNLVFSLSLITFILFGVFVMVGTANSVNLTDGLDGLVSIPAFIVAMTFAAMAYITGRADFTQYLNIPYIPGAGEIAIVCSALAGSMLGFLWFNAPPARIFLGDTGSLPVGGILGAVAVLIKQEFALAIIGGLFVLETISVIVQVVSVRLIGRRVFKMAPLHHHFEQQGWPESTIVVRFWIISVLLALIGLATLKLR